MRKTNTSESAGGGGGGGSGGCDKTIKDFAVNDITVTEQKLLELAKETRDRR